MTIRVAHVNVAKSYRGGERQTELLIRELAKRGVTQRLVARRDAPLAGRLHDLDVDVAPVSGSFWSVAKATSGVDLVHVHEGRSIYGAYLRLLLSGTPYIATRRVDNPIGAHWLAHKAYRHAAFIAAVAPQVACIVRAFDPKIAVRVIHSSHSGFTVDRDCAVEIRRSLGGDLVIGTVAALDIKQKAQEHIIEVARQMQVSHPGARFVLVGTGADENVLKQMASDLSNVIFTGFVDNVADYLAAFDVFILPSRAEGIGSVLLDAMRQQLPIIATRVGGVPEIVHDSVNGILIEPERPDQLADAIAALAASPERRAELGAHGPAIADRYGSSRMAERYLELYEHAIQRQTHSVGSARE
jgi:glycosyltransferase involved in cell wall biosynthesis